MEEQLIWTHEYSLKYEKVKHAQETGTGTTIGRESVSRLRVSAPCASTRRSGRSPPARATIRGGTSRPTRTSRRRRANERCVGQGTREGWP